MLADLSASDVPEAMNAIMPKKGIKEIIIPILLAALLLLRRYADNTITLAINAILEPVNKIINVSNSADNALIFTLDDDVK